MLVEKNGLLTTQSGVQVEEGVIILPKIPFYALRAIIFNVLIYFYSSSPSVRQNQDLENINLVTLLTSSVHKFTFSDRLPLSTALGMRLHQMTGIMRSTWMSPTHHCSTSNIHKYSGGARAPGQTWRQPFRTGRSQLKGICQTVSYIIYLMI